MNYLMFVRLILSWYRMIGNTDFMYDGPQSRENISSINECEQLVCNPPEEFQNSIILQYFIGRSHYLKVNTINYYSRVKYRKIIIFCISSVLFNFKIDTQSIKNTNRCFIF